VSVRMSSYAGARAGVLALALTLAPVLAACGSTESSGAAGPAAPGAVAPAGDVTSPGSWGAAPGAVPSGAAPGGVSRGSSDAASPGAVSPGSFTPVTSAWPPIGTAPVPLPTTPAAPLPTSGPWSVRTTTITGPRSGVTARIIVWAPPEYYLPSNAGRKFPVVQLVGGFPGSPSTWFHGVQLLQGYRLARAAGAPPAIFVATEVNVAGRTDLECLDGPNGVKVETWITQDVPSYVRAHFRTAGRDGWGIMGYSMGGFCAPYLALAHSSVYSAAVAMDGYPIPGTDLWPHAWLAAHSVYSAIAKHPPVAILWVTDQRDHESPVRWGPDIAVRAAAPTSVTTRVVPGTGHQTWVWREQIPGNLLWLLPRLKV